MWQDKKGCVKETRTPFLLRAREKITLHSCISFSGHLCPIFIRRILNVALAMFAVQLNQIDQICPKPERNRL